MKPTGRSTSSMPWRMSTSMPRLWQSRCPGDTTKELICESKPIFGQETETSSWCDGEFVRGRDTWWACSPLCGVGMASHHLVQKTIIVESYNNDLPHCYAVMSLWLMQQAAEVALPALNIAALQLDL